MKFKKVLWTALGCVGLGLGAVGVVVPLLPSFPFLLLALVGFAKSSEKLHRWFLNTRLYKNNLESYVPGPGDDLADQAAHHTHSDAVDGLWVCHDAAEGTLRPLRDPGRGVGVPPALFCFAGQNTAGAGIGRIRRPLRYLLWPWNLREVIHRGSAGVVLAKMVPVQLGGDRPLLLWATALLAT